MYCFEDILVLRNYLYIAVIACTLASMQCNSHDQLSDDIDALKKQVTSAEKQRQQDLKDEIEALTNKLNTSETTVGQRQQDLKDEIEALTNKLDTSETTVRGLCQAVYQLETFVRCWSDMHIEDLKKQGLDLKKKSSNQLQGGQETYKKKEELVSALIKSTIAVKEIVGDLRDKDGSIPQTILTPNLATNHDSSSHDPSTPVPLQGDTHPISP
jgi:predicted nuclease with TOPRIM domain